MADVLFTNVRIFDGGGEAPFAGDVLVQGNRISRIVKTGYGQRTPAGAGRHHHRWRGRVPDARHGRGAHPLQLERPAQPGCHPAHAARRAHPVVRRGGEEVPRHGLDQLRRRRRRQAAAGRGDPQRHQRRHHRRPPLSGRQPGDHRARRPGRHHRAAPAATRVCLRRHRQRRRGDAPLRAHVRQVRRRLAEDQPERRIDHRHARRNEPVHRGRGPRVRRGGQGLGQARGRACALGLVGEAMHQARHRGHLPRQLHRRRSAGHARGAQVRALRRPRPGLADQHQPPRLQVGPDARGDQEDGLPPRARSRHREHEGDAQARHPHPARRRLRLRLDAARHQCQGPGVLRQVRRHEHRWKRCCRPPPGADR